LVTAGFILSHFGQKTAAEEFKKVNGTFSSLEVSLFSRSITITDVHWKSQEDSLQSEASISRVRLQGISLFQLILNKQLYAETLRIDSGAITYQTSHKKDSTQKSSRKSFPFEIQNIVIREVFVKVKQDSVTQIEALLNLRYGALKMDSLSNLQMALKSAFRYLQGDVTHVKLKKANGLYASKVDRIAFDSENESLSIDSLKLIPLYGKYEFAHVREKQMTRLNLSVRNIGITGLNFNAIFDSLISIRKIAIDAANLHSFRDKRVPLKNGIMDMPMHALQNSSLV